eukprot:SAG31_NODE_977_length_10615_cov_93.546786_2_plen_127_part_00
MGSAGQLFLLAGTVLYTKFFKHWSYRSIFAMTQMIGLVLGCTDLFWVSRLNLELGISDQAFVLSGEIISPIVMQLGSLPQFVLAAALCPPGTEATLFALMMGVNNFGGTVGSYTGALTMEVLGGVR